jgi:predicted cupin superfamily sugar epimerase
VTPPISVYCTSTMIQVNSERGGIPIPQSNADRGHGMVPAHGLTTIFYLLEKARDAAFAREGVERLIGVFAVAPVDDNAAA